MTRRTRRFIFYGFVAIFIIITPPTILYAVGYTYNWQKQTLVQAGGIYLKSTPAAASITLNGKENGDTPRLVSRLAPDTYGVTVSQDTYYSWQKKLEVLPQLVTEARNIRLFPKKIEPELMATNSTSTLADFLKTDQEKQNDKLASQTASSTAGWILKNDFIFFISKIGFSLYREDINGNGVTQISKGPLVSGHYRLFTNDGRYFAALSDNGDLFLLNQDTGFFGLIAKEIKDAAVSSDNKKILYWNSNEIWVYFLQEILIQPYKKTGDKELITRFAQKISQAIFYPDNEYVAFVVGDQLKITELDDRDQRNTVDFLQTNNPQIYFDQGKNYLYYLSQNQIFRIGLK